MSGKKRKATGVEDQRPSKKSSSEISVTFVQGSKSVKPVIADAPGISLPSKLELQPFSKQASHDTSTLLLRSSSHPTIDFTAKEGESQVDAHLRHYVAVFDPAAKTLQLTEAKHLTVRSSLRKRGAADDSDEEDKPKPLTQLSGRAALTEAFGTKKAKKAVQSIAENRLLARFGNDEENPLSSAILSTMSAPEPVEEVTSLSRAHKPLPTPNLETRDINEVYRVASLVFPHPPSSTLELMSLGPWKESYQNTKAITSASRFVTNRASYLIKAHLLDTENQHPELKLKLQLLRYILLLIELFNVLRRTSSTKNLPFVAKWSSDSISGNIPKDMLVKLVKKFCPDNKGLGKNSTMLLQSTIMALALHIPPPSLNAGANMLVTEPTDLQLDLAMKPDDMRRLYRELGCKVEGARPGELVRWGLEKKMMTTKSQHLDEEEDDDDDEREDNDKKAGRATPTSKSQVRFAKLTFPIEFPTVTAVRLMGKKRR